MNFPVFGDSQFLPRASLSKLMAVSPEDSSSAREMQMVAAATVLIVRKVPVQLSSSLVIQPLLPFPTFCAPWLLNYNLLIVGIARR